MSNKHSSLHRDTDHGTFCYNNWGAPYHPMSDRKIMTSEKARLTNYSNSAMDHTKTYQKIDLENLLNRVFNPESCFKLFVLYNSFHKKYR